MHSMNSVMTSRNDPLPRLESVIKLPLKLEKNIPDDSIDREISDYYLNPGPEDTRLGRLKYELDNIKL